MPTIELAKFYKMIDKGEFAGRVYVEKPYVDGGLFEILETLGVTPTDHSPKKERKYRNLRDQ